MAFALVVFSPTVWGAIDHDAVHARFVRATGVLSEYRGRPQIRIDDPKSLVTR